MRDIPLLDGTALPELGFGTYPLRGEEGVAAIASAIDLGYRLVDTAVNYGNESEVGEAIRRSGTPRERLTVTTKIPGRDHGYDEALASIAGSRAALGIEVLDLVLIHWPNPSVDRYVDTWRGMIEAQRRGEVRSIGVSNFTIGFLERLESETGVLPVVNQIELHPFFPQEELRAFHAAKGIVTEAWSPLGKAAPVQQAAPVVAAAEAHEATPAQVVLAWHRALGSVAIPKSADPARQAENLGSLEVTLADDEVAAITALGRPDGRLFGGDPESHEEM